MKEWLKSPAHFAIVGALVLSFGVNSIFTNLGNWTRGEGGVDGSFIFIFFGLGILRGKGGNLGCVLTLFGLSMVASLIFVIVAVFTGDFSGGLWSKVSFIAVFLVIMAYCFGTIWLAPEDNLLEEEARKRYRFMIPVTIVLTSVYSAGYEWRLFSQAEQLNQIFRYDFEVIVRNAETGELIQNVAVRFPPHNFDDLDVPDWMKSTTSLGPKSDKAAIVLEGYALGGTDIQISHEGFESVQIPIDRTTGSVIEVRLKPE